MTRLVGDSGAAWRVTGHVIALGGQAAVYPAIAEDDGHEVVIKVSLAPNARDDVVRAEGLRLRELALNPVAAPHVVPLWDCGSWDGRPFLVLERRAGTLATWLTAAPAGARVEVARRLVDAVAQLQQADPPVVHGDLKPSNILVDEANPPALLFADFGAAADGPEGPALTPAYASPERLRGGAPDAASDRYALAAMVQVLLDGVPEHEVARRVLDAMLDPSPARRPALAALAAALAGHQEHRAPPASASLVAVAFAVGLLVQPSEEAPAPGCPPGFTERDDGACVHGDGRVVRQVPHGTFAMGRGEGDKLEWTADAPSHEVTLTRAFWLSEKLVTQAEWTAVMGTNPVATRQQDLGQNVHHACASWLGRSLVGPELPVMCVSWWDAVAFANLRSVRDGLVPAYRVVAQDGQRGVEWDPLAEGWRLPTEAEWEWAARAGTRSPWVAAPDRDGTCAFGNVRDADALEFWGGEVACHDGAPLLSPVGAYRPNPWGFYDMHGNVLEWLWDRYGDYPAGRVVDPTGPVTGASRVQRGSSWNHVAKGVAARYASDPSEAVFTFGVRLARTASSSRSTRSAGWKANSTMPR